MKISKSSENEKNNSKYYNLYKIIQNAIKDKIIDKHLFIIESQSKEITQLKKENILLKNHLTYILKKILLNKSEYISTSNHNRLNNFNSLTSNTHSMILRDNSRKSSNTLRPLRSVENYRCITEKITSRYKDTNHNTSYINIRNNTLVDNKVNGYLNSLYRHNFGNNYTNGGTFFLNKNQTLIEELFPNRNNSFCMNNDNEQILGTIRNYSIKIKKKRENNSTDKRNVIKTKNLKNNTQIVVNSKNKNSIGKRNKTKNLDNNNENKKNNINHVKNNNNELVDLNENKYNTINNSGNIKKNKFKKSDIYCKRSPFIVNKFSS